MAVTSTPSRTQGSIGQVSGFIQLAGEGIARLRDEVQEDVVDDADGGKKEQDPGKGACWLPARNRVTGRTGLRHDTAQPGGRQGELDNPRSGHAAEDGRITALRKTKPKVPHFISLEEGGRNPKDEGDRREQAKEEVARRLARAQEIRDGGQHGKGNHHRPITLAGWTHALPLPALIVVDRPQVEKSKPPGGKEEDLGPEEQPGADGNQARIEQRLGIGGGLVAGCYRPRRLRRGRR